MAPESDLYRLILRSKLPSTDGYRIVSVKHWKEQDHYLLNHPHKKIQMLEVHPKGASCPFINKKIPLYNENNECVGIVNHVKYLEIYRPNDFIRGKLPGSLLLNKPDELFTEKECEVIFLQLQRLMQSVVHLSSRLMWAATLLIN